MIDFSNVSRHFTTGRGTVAALRDVTLRVEKGEWVVLVGRSGSGKSTLLNLIAGLDRPSAGATVVAGTDLAGLDEEALARWRARHVGVVFQFFQLLPTLTALENVVLPMAFAGRAPARGDRVARARELLTRVGVSHLHDQLPGELSGGEQQRIAVARALANRPPLLLADEPTGNLDAASGAAVLALLIDYWREGGTLVVATHDPAIAAAHLEGHPEVHPESTRHPSPRVVRLDDGVLLPEAVASQTVAADD